MEFFGKFVNRFQGLSQVKIPAVSKERSNNHLEHHFREHDIVTLTMLYLKVLHDMISLYS